MKNMIVNYKFMIRLCQLSLDLLVCAFAFFQIYFYSSFLSRFFRSFKNGSCRKEHLDGKKIRIIFAGSIDRNKGKCINLLPGI